MAGNRFTQHLYPASPFSKADKKLRRGFATNHTWNHFASSL